jgi:hypothetical protein
MFKLLSVVRGRLALLALSVAAFVSMALASVASAEPVVDIKPAVESATAEYKVAIGVILTLIAIIVVVGLVIRTLRKHAK